MTDHIELIRDTLAHWPIDKGYYQSSVDNAAALDMAEAVARDLAEDGYVIVKVAEPVFITNDGRQDFSDGSTAGEVEACPEQGVVYHGEWEWTSDEAMDVGRQWISAAVVAGENRTVKQ